MKKYKLKDPNSVIKIAGRPDINSSNITTELVEGLVKENQNFAQLFEEEVAPVAALTK